MSAWIPQARAKMPTRLPRLAEQAVERARLTVVPRRTRAPRVPFMVLVSAVLLLGVLGLLMFNTSMQQASFHATALQAQADQLHATEQSLRMEIDRLRDPQRVAMEAERRGMVPLVNPAFIRLPGGQVTGNPAPALPGDAQRITPLPSRKPKAFRKAPIKVIAHQSPDTGVRGVPSDQPPSGGGTTGVQH